jgi:hypothetical protein
MEYRGRKDFAGLVSTFERGWMDPQKLLPYKIHMALLPPAFLEWKLWTWSVLLSSMEK